MNHDARTTAADLSPTKLALLKIRDLKRQLGEAQDGQCSDIAIVSMACRFPRRSHTPEAFWESLLQGTDEVGEVPDDRWDLEAYYDADPDVAGKMYARKGVFLEHLDLMDPEFFGISPREATWVDPQQRLLLEVSWEALERAGWPSDEIGEDTGLFVGWMHNDYSNESSDSLLNLNPYIATGSAGSFLSGRLSYYLGLQGPSVAIDTACSSSLVALHLACQSLHRQECGRALVGGVNAIVSPTTNILTCKLKALSPAGHSRAFDAQADGYLRGEGCGMVTLRRLADARRDGDPILGVIRGSAVGHNGFSSGLTAPNPKAQERVIRQALERAGIDAAEVDYLEAHGTGTELGDPIEMQAAAAVLADGRDPAHPLLVGSVKTNIGHLEAAAGIAGLIKVLLAFEHNTIAPQLHFDEPNPHIPWEQMAVKVVVEPTAWPGDGRRRIAGVSAFGMSGTNAHVVLESPPENGRSPVASAANDSRTERSYSAGNGNQATGARERGPHERVTRKQDTQDNDKPKHVTREYQLLVLSAKSEEALRDLAEDYRQWLLAHPQQNLADVAYTAAAGRRHFMNHRAALVVNSSRQAEGLLEHVAHASNHAGLFQGQRRTVPKVAWQFTGQGSQYVGMAKGLYASQPAFREALDQCDRLLQEWRRASLLQVLFDDQELIHQTRWTQPGIFAIQMGLVHLLRSWGLEPDVVMGHSVGQFAAACVAGILSWEDGLRLIGERGRLMGDLPPGGAMTAIFAAPDEIQVALAAHAEVSLAALNGTHSVISGPEAAVDAVAGQLADRGVRVKRLTTSHAFHSSLMDSALDPFQRVADQIDFQAARVPLVCNITGKPLPAREVLTGDYWRRHIRAPVRYAESVLAAKDLGCEVMLELGPQAILTPMAAAIWGGSTSGLISCLSKDTEERKTLLAAVAQLYAHGITPDFRAMDRRKERRRLILPTYPFQRRRFWGPAKPQTHQFEVHTAHPLLGERRPLAGMPRETRYEGWIARDRPGWLEDHQVMGDIVFPGAAFVEMALAVEPSNELRDIAFEQPLRPAQQTCLQTIVRTDEQKQKTIETHSLAQGATRWSRHLTATLAPMTQEPPTAVDRAAIAERCTESAEVADFYQMMQGLGLDYGSQFQTLSSLHYCQTEVLARLETSGDLRGYTIPPTLLDGAFHSLAVGLMRDSQAALFLPAGIERMQCFRAVDNAVWCHARWNQAEGETRTADLTLFDDDNQVVACIENLRLRELNRAALRQMAGSGPQRLLYELNWKAARLPPSNKHESYWLVVSQATSAEDSQHDHRSMLAANVRRALVENGQHVLSVQLDEPLSEVEFSGSSAKLTGDQPDQWCTLFDQWLATESVDAPQGIVWLLGDGSDVAPNGQDSLEDTRHNCVGLLGLIAALRERNIRRLDRGLQLVTCNGVSCADAADPAARMDENSVPVADSRVDAAQAKYWGLGRAIGAEQPTLQCRLVDVQLADGPAGEAVVNSLVDALLNDSRENQMAIRDGRVLVPRLAAVQSPPQEPSTQPESRTESAESQTALPESQTASKPDAIFPLSADASFLITGGLGMLGRQAALWLARRGAKHVVLVSRRAPNDAAQDLIREIEQLDCQVCVQPADLGTRADVRQLLDRFGNDLPPLRGVIHAAGVLDDALLADQSWTRFEKVLAPKVRGAWLLHELTADMPLDFFVLYSSATSVLGTPGQSNYATANAYLDGLAWQRRAEQRPALSVNWGPWTEGMADNEVVVKRLALQGITPLTVAEAHEALERMLAANMVQATVLDVDWRRMRMGLGGESPPVLDDLSPTGVPSRAGDSVLVEKLKKLRGPARRKWLFDTIQSELQDVLSTPDTPDPDTPLIEMGLDSLMAVEFSTRLQQQLGDDFAIAPTLLFDYPTVTAITDYLSELMIDLPGGEPTTETPTVVSAPTAQDEIAIIGMSCRFPGASSLNEFWDNLQNGVDAIRDVPADRWNVEQYYDPSPAPGKMYTRAGGFLDDVGHFDAEFFNISAQEACWTDPQHRLMLEVSWDALEDAGICAHPLRDPKVGVFMGIMSQDYGELLSANDVELIDAFQGGGLSHSAGVGRVSYAFGFEGPSIAIDSASSSSLVAVCEATNSLLEGKCNLALAGGVNAVLTPTNSLLLCKVKMLSPDGRCKSFSAAADGFGRGEGCGMVVLKRRSDAERDGDRILALIRGSAVGHNGFSGGLTSPNGRSQERLIRDALEDAGIQATQVQYLEAHGTGTEFGDAIEIGAAATVLGKGRSADQPLLVGSVKANIGHLEAAGGISGLIKAVLAMNRGTIPRQLHFDEPSPHVPWQRLPLKVVTEPTAWPESAERFASVTALGLSGTNAHVIISSPESADPEEAIPPAASHHLMVLSARKDSALRQLAEQYLDLLEGYPDVELADICHTLATGRRHFEQRLALVVESAEQTCAMLSSLVDGRSLPYMHRGQASHSPPKLAWFFGGTNRDLWSVGGQLYETEPEFRQVLEQCEQAYQTQFETPSQDASDETLAADAARPSLLDWLRAHGENDSDSQPPRPGAAVMLFALQIGLARMWQAWGVEPDAVMGHGLGQYAAACTTGVMKLEDGIKLVAARDRLHANLGPAAEGGSLAVQGEQSAAVQTALDEFEALADTVDYFPADRPLICDLSGKVVPMHRMLGGSHWRRHCVEAPKVAEGLKSLAETDCAVVLELGPPPRGSDKLLQMWPDRPPLWLFCLQPQQNEQATLIDALAQLFASGLTPDFTACYKHRRKNKVSLPTYPFQRSRYWITDVGKYVVQKDA